jgi:hypothetical protein
MTSCSISQEMGLIAVAISDRRRDERFSQFSAFNPTFNSRLAGEGSCAPFVDDTFDTVPRA